MYTSNTSQQMTTLTEEDLNRGKELFMLHCARCHTCHKDGESNLGPNLFGIFGRESGAIPNFDYTKAIKKKNIIWNADNLCDYLKRPWNFIPGTRMVFSGIRDPDDRSNLLEYLLRASSDNE